MKLGALVGTTTAPADPSTITASVEKLFANAVASSGCETPYIALNELNGASTTTPWTATNSRYRQNILDVLRALQAKGARPFLLVSSFPYTGGDAAGWWREAAQVADIVPEIYFNAPAVMRQGVILGSPADADDAAERDRRLHRDRDPGVEARLRARLPVRARAPAAARGCSRRRSGSGSPSCTRSLRSGSRPSSAIATVWSWGWGTFNAAGADPDKQAAACVFLWTRDASLCDGPGGGRARTSRTRVSRGSSRRSPQGAQCIARRPRAAADRPLADDRRDQGPRRRLHDPLRPARRDRPREDLGRPRRRRRSRRSSTVSSAAAGRPTTRRSRRRARTRTSRAPRSRTSSCARRSRARCRCRRRPTCRSGSSTARTRAS